MQLSEHFSLDEMTRSSTAKRLSIDNTPPLSAIKNLTVLCQEVLEPARKLYGHPFIINSGYRCVKLNRAVGGVTGSYHCQGRAADIACTDYTNVDYLVSCLYQQPKTDTILVEYTRTAIWVHVQWSDKPRHHVNKHYNA